MDLKAYVILYLRKVSNQKDALRLKQNERDSENSKGQIKT